MIVSVDPGTVSAAFSIITLDKEVIRCSDMPMKNNQNDYESFIAILKQYPIKLSAIEQVSAAPKQGVSSTFSFGYSTGVFYGILLALEIPILKLRPSVWKSLLAISSKEDSLRKAKELFPNYNELKLKKDHNRAESLLMAYLACKTIRP
jgi:crossover junction endodeoxyribonuclease RuvC